MARQSKDKFYAQETPERYTALSTCPFTHSVIPSVARYLIYLHQEEEIPHYVRDDKEGEMRFRKSAR